MTSSDHGSDTVGAPGDPGTDTGARRLWSGSKFSAAPVPVWRRTAICILLKLFPFELESSKEGEEAEVPITFVEHAEQENI